MKAVNGLKTTIVIWLARRSPVCQDIAPLISRSLDMRLSWRQRVTLRLHLAICQACTRYLAQLNFLHETMQTNAKKFDEIPDPPILSSAARARIQQKLAAHNEAAIKPKPHTQS